MYHLQTLTIVAHKEAVNSFINREITRALLRELFCLELKALTLTECWTTVITTHRNAELKQTKI